MSILNDLIRIKTSAQEDDLIKMLDEVPIYEKLSVNKQFRDLKSSKVTRTKCPLLAAFADNKPYETLLADLVTNIYLQIEGRIPDIFNAVIERTPKQQKQFEILQKGIACVTYYSLTQYKHETMSDRVVAVFTEKNKGIVTAVIIVRCQDGYEMYHGSYAISETERINTTIIDPVVVKGNKGVFTMDTYSMLGNNGYRFGRYSNNNIFYDVMISMDEELFLMEDENIVVQYKIPYEEKNMLNIAKKEPEDFAKTVLSIIESVV